MGLLQEARVMYLYMEAYIWWMQDITDATVAQF
jgi:hypothetical protein